jgi:dipeptidyl aminopeptidase/acylaminoacyl peptidase
VRLLLRFAVFGTLCLGLVSAEALGQALPGKKVLQHSDYEIWNSASDFKLSPDGKVFVYKLSPPTGDSSIVIRNIPTGAETRFATTGKAPAPSVVTPEPPPETPPTGGPGLRPTPTLGQPAFSPDSKTLFFVLRPTADVTAKAKADKKKPEEMPKGQLAVYDVATGKITERIDKVRNFTVIGDGAGFLVIQKESDTPEPPKTPEAKELKEEPKIEAKKEPMPPIGAVAGAATTAVPGPTRVVAYDLIVRNLKDGKDVTFTGVSAHTALKDGKQMLLTMTAKTTEKSGLFLLTLGGESLTAIRSGAGKITSPTWNEDQSQLAFFVADTGTPAKLKLHHWKRSDTKEAAEVTITGLKPEFVILDRNLAFSTDGLKLGLTVGPAPVVVPEAKTETAPMPTPMTPGPRPTGGLRGPRTFGGALAAPAEEKVELDLWHWKDEAIQPMQKLRGAADRSKSYRAVYFLDTKQFQQLGTDDFDVTVPNFGDWALATSDKAYKAQLWRSPIPKDYALLNIRSGEGKPLLTLQESPVAAPYGNFALAFNGKDWLSYALPDGKAINLTAKLKIPFAREDFDTPGTPSAYPLAGWTADKKHVILSDKYDLWKFALDGSTAVNLTLIGRELKTTFRIVKLDEDDDTLKLDLSKPMLLSATNNETQDTGFYRLEASAKPKLLVMSPRKYGTPTKAKSANTLVMTVSSFAQYADYYATDLEFREVKRLTDIQPRQREFNWGTAELVNYKSADGLPLKGLLIKPEDFDSTKQYPMIVYIYERLTDTMHNYRAPAAGTSINPTFYASNGYLVFMPDIAYTTGAPGQSALKCVLPAIQAVVDKGNVNEAAIGIQGHSWGGYQIAYLITQTHRFKAAAAGAPVANMTSAYGGIRWGTGMPRQFQYEKTQSRIGETLWQAPMKYIENSPVFMADRVKTPLMMLHNDQDDAVPWYQGIEYYMALRRLEKEVYLFNYNGELHGLRKKINQRDYTLRMQQFFDYHLKGAPMPEWMSKGIPFSERDKEKEQWKKLFR